LIYSTS